MNVEMSKREELSDADLDGVPGGGVGTGRSDVR